MAELRDLLGTTPEIRGPHRRIPRPHRLDQARRRRAAPWACPGRCARFAGLIGRRIERGPACKVLESHLQAARDARNPPKSETPAISSRVALPLTISPLAPSSQSNYNCRGCAAGVARTNDIPGARRGPIGDLDERADLDMRVRTAREGARCDARTHGPVPELRRPAQDARPGTCSSKAANKPREAGDAGYQLEPVKEPSALVPSRSRPTTRSSIAGCFHRTQATRLQRPTGSCRPSTGPKPTGSRACSIRCEAPTAWA